MKYNFKMKVVVVRRRPVGAINPSTGLGFFESGGGFRRVSRLLDGESTVWAVVVALVNHHVGEEDSTLRRAVLAYTPPTSGWEQYNIGCLNYIVSYVNPREVGELGADEIVASIRGMVDW